MTLKTLINTLLKCYLFHKDTKKFLNIIIIKLGHILFLNKFMTWKLI